MGMSFHLCIISPITISMNDLFSSLTNAWDNPQHGLFIGWCILAILWSLVHEDLSCIFTFSEEVFFSCLNYVEQNLIYVNSETSLNVKTFFVNTVSFSIFSSNVLWKK